MWFGGPSIPAIGLQTLVDVLPSFRDEDDLPVSDSNVEDFGPPFK